MSINSKNFDRYMKTYNGQKLFSRLNEVGVWHVRGEDSNCDMEGPHYMPTLGFFSGKLGDIITYAVELPKFWQWGGGGDFTRIEIIEIDKDAAMKLAEVRMMKKDLEDQLKVVEAKLSALGVKS